MFKASAVFPFRELGVHLRFGPSFVKTPSLPEQPGSFVSVGLGSPSDNGMNGGNVSSILSPLRRSLRLSAPNNREADHEIRARRLIVAEIGRAYRGRNGGEGSVS